MESVEDLFIQGLDLTIEKKYTEAVAVYHKVLAQDPKYMDAYHSLSMTHLYLNQLDEAIAVEKKALEVNPDELLSFSNLSVFYQKKGMIKEAEAAKGQATILTWRKEAKDKKQAPPPANP